MKIKKIELNHFKRFTKLNIDLWNTPRKIIALVWPNWCWKSSIFDSFEEILKNFKTTSVSASWPEYYSKKYFIDWENSSYNKNESIKIYNEDNNTTFNKKSFYIRTSYRFTPKFNVSSISKLDDIIEDKNRPSQSISLDTRLEENYKRLIWKLVNEFQNGEKTWKIWRQEYLDKINTVLTEILNIKIKDLWDILNWKWQLYFEKWTSKNFPYENLSSWEKEVIDIILDLIVKTQDYDDTIYCIDEPELHINTSIQRKLLIEIEKLIPNNCQLWIATHSIWFIRAFQSEELNNKVQILDFSEKDFDSEINLEPITLNRKNFQKIFNIALDDLTWLLAPKYIVYCEWRVLPNWENWEEKWLDAIIYNNIFETELWEYYFISSWWHWEIDRNSIIALKVLEKAFIDSEILLFKDRDFDPNWNLINDSKRNEELNKNKNLRILKRREIENYLFDYEILSKIYPDLVKKEYEKYILDIINDDIKLKINDLKTICKETRSISNEKWKKEISKNITIDTEVYKELKSVLLNT